MKYAQRMVLVPEADFDEQKKLQQKRKEKKYPSVKPCKKRRDVKHKLAFLNAPARKLYRQHRAAVKASQDVAKLTLAPQQQEPPSHPNILKPDQTTDDENKEQESTPNVLKTIPEQHRARAKKILNALLRRGYRFTTDKRIQLPTGRVLTRTNIMEILHAASVKDYRGKARRPAGWTEFIDSVIRYGVPQSVFTKNSVKVDLEQRSKYYSSESDEPVVWETYL